MSLRAIRRQAERLARATEPLGLRTFLAVLVRDERGRLSPLPAQHGDRSLLDVQWDAAVPMGLTVILNRKDRGRVWVREPLA